MKNCKHKEVDTADLCEVGHTITAEICRAKKIPINCTSERSCNAGNDHSKQTLKEMSHYSGKAQRIFNKYFDLLDNTFRN